MIEIGKGGQRAVRTVMMSRYACYLVGESKGTQNHEKLPHNKEAANERYGNAGCFGTETAAAGGRFCSSRWG